MTLSHGFDPTRAQQLAALVERFNATDAKGQVRVVDDPAAADSAAIRIVQGEAERTLRQRGAFRPLYQVMADAGLSLARDRGLTAYDRDTLDSRGRRVALPVGLHTPVLFINRRAFEEAGLDPNAPPRTWRSLQEALGKLFDAGHACPYTVSRPSWVMVDNVSARQNVALTRRVGRAEQLTVNGMLQIRHIALMASWVRARYLHLYGAGGEPAARFARGECAVIAAESADWPALRQAAAFDVGVGELPFYDDFPGGVGATLADGPTLWVAKGKKRADYQVAARFVRFLLKPENQLAWQRGTGYLPLDEKGGVAEGGIAEDQPNLLVARKQLSVGSTLTAAASELPRQARVRSILEEELDGVWADRQPAKQALDNAVARTGGGL
ncbi:extracellular solute-binding protein [Denitromonas iodatirespirans]|uniref:sn-glycerol-3-phosphate-binding periplasmic protein UgpB n=1 Tax=Denitromonas iodatirespirans TaxID=2795389 RepID=A0A944DDV2_DENI1|nr:extracellular solute-binding protein [Denitromonas iodatirespirans]MBT0962522.1 extracellular solute-binding protein [Denitromonas iodatirespirans]